jgi:hypothetical protein
MKRDRNSIDETSIKRVKVAISKLVKSIVPHSLSQETLATPSTEWTSRSSFESVLSTYSSYELDGATEGRTIGEALETGNGFLKISDQAKNREKKWKAKEDAWKKEREEFLKSKTAIDEAKKKLEDKV